MARQFPYNHRVDGRYGAPMGRPDDEGDPDYTGRLTLRRVPLDDGYDGGGAYWGSRLNGESLFCAWSPDRSIVRFFDAKGLRAAVETLREDYGNAGIHTAAA